MFLLIVFFSKVWRDEWLIPISKLRKGLMSGVRLDVFFPGFPTLKHIPHEAKLSTGNVRVFEQSSRGENMILHLQVDKHPENKVPIQDYLGKEIWVAWPHMMEAKVVEVADKNFIYSFDRNGQVLKVNADESKVAAFDLEVKTIKEKWVERKTI